MDLHKTEIRMKDLILQELDIFRPQFNSKKIRTETQFGKGADRVLADPDKMTQAVTNLLQNASQ
jgi:signal transduction histidine kinase